MIISVKTSGGCKLSFVFSISYYKCPSDLVSFILLLKAWFVPNLNP